MNKDSETESADIDLNNYLWKNRIVIVFVNSANNPDYLTFKDDWDSHNDEVHDRDLILIEIFNTKKGFVNGKIMGEDALRTITSKMNPQESFFEVILIGKDGTTKLRSSNSSPSKVFDLIDTMPMRQNEIMKKANN